MTRKMKTTMTKKRKINQSISLPIHDIGSHGEGVGRLDEDGYTVFVDGALPGENVEAIFTQCQKRYGRADLVTVHNPSPDRVLPPCPLFGRCGGCQIMHISYEKQLEIKREKVVAAITRIGKLDNISILPCISSPQTLHYRNKIQLPVRRLGNKNHIGLFARQTNDLIDVETCLIHCPLGEAVYREIRPLIIHSPIHAYCPKTGSGELRHVLIKSAIQTNEVLVILVSNHPLSKELRHLAKEIRRKCPSVRGVVYNKNTGRDNIVLGSEFSVIEGSGTIQERICNLTFSISPASFFQVNPQTAENLYRKALEVAELKGDETVLDAYCGVGTLSLIFAPHVKHVTGVECVPEAIEDAKRNAEVNGITNTAFMCDQSEVMIQKIPPGTIDVVLLNPPRKGCDPSFLTGIKALRPKRLVYISCDPATLARDLALLQEFGYEAKSIQPFDMFPQTAHVECVVSLSLNKSRQA